MKTKHLDSAVKHNPCSLHDALKAAGIPVLTIRSDWATDERDQPLQSVIVFADGYDPDEPTNATAIAAVLAVEKDNPKVKNKATPIAPIGYDFEQSKLKLSEI